MIAQVAQGRLDAAQATADRYSAIAPASPFAERLQADRRGHAQGLPERPSGGRERRPEARPAAGSPTSSPPGRLHGGRNGKVASAKAAPFHRLLAQCAAEKAPSPMHIQAAAPRGARDAVRRTGTAQARCWHPRGDRHSAGNARSARAAVLMLAEPTRCSAGGEVADAAGILAPGPRGHATGRAEDILSATGALAVAEGKNEEAIAPLPGWPRRGDCRDVRRVRDGAVYDRRGQADSAIAALREWRTRSLRSMPPGSWITTP